MNYENQKSRFSLVMYYNGKKISTIDTLGRKHEAKRDFDAAFYEPIRLGNNPLNGDMYKKLVSLDKKLKNGSINDEMRNRLESEMISLESKMIFMGENNSPHVWERNVFENSWESVEMGEQLVETFRAILRDGTENFYQDVYLSAKMKNSVDKLNITRPNGGNNEFSIVVLDNQSIRRHPKSGERVDIIDMKNEYDELLQRDLYNSLGEKEQQRLFELERELSKHYVKREIFRCSFSADDYSYDGSDFTPPLSLIWKDFNVELKSRRSKNVEYADISEFNSIRNELAKCKQQRAKVLNSLEIANKHKKTMDVASLQRSLDKLNNKIKSYRNTYFRGVRSIVKYYLSMDRYTNRYLHPKAKHNNYDAFSCESEMTKYC